MFLNRILRLAKLHVYSHHAYIPDELSGCRTLYEITGETLSLTNLNHVPVSYNTTHMTLPDTCSLDRKLDNIRDIPHKQVGERVAFRARVHHIRPLGTDVIILADVYQC